MLPPLPVRLLLLAAPLAAAGSRYCGSDTPLDTPYFAPFQQTVAEAVGCVAATPPGSAYSGHVLRLEQPSDEVNLHILDAGGDDQQVGLFLDSDRPVIWRLAALPSPPPPLLLMTAGAAGSRVLDGQGSLLPSRHAAQLGPASSPEARMKLAVEAFQHVATFTILKSANKIVINLPQAINTSTNCNLHNLIPSPAVTAFTAVKQSTFGCFHPEAAGVLPQDVHVIDLKTSPSTPERRRRRHASPPPRVEVDLVPNPGESGQLARNLTLILKSDAPVRWSLRSHGITGNLLVAAGGNAVENLSVSSDQHLDIDKSDMPDQFEKLMWEVTEQFGLPLAYVRVHSANLLQMVVPPRSKREVSTFLERDRSNLLRDPPPSRSEEPLPDILEETDPLEEAAERLRESMTKLCAVSRTEVAVTSSIVAALHIDRLHLNDPSCRAVANGTHHVVASHSTACGSTALTYGNSPMFRNNLVAVFAGGSSLAGQQIKIPYICKFKPGIPGIIPVMGDQVDTRQQEHTHQKEDPDQMEDREEEEEEEEKEEAENPDLESGEEMYGLRVELQPGGVQLLTSRADSAPVALYDDIYVQSHINAVRYLALAIEQCWLSASPRVTSHAGPGDLRLVMAGCPVQRGVNMHWDPSSANAAFSFKVVDDMVGMGQAWLQCRMGLCSATSAGAQGNVLRCEDPAEACREGRTHRESSLQQVTVRGPLHLLPVTRERLAEARPITGRQPPPLPLLPEAESAASAADDDEEDHEEGADGAAGHVPHNSTLVGVTVEVAVAIAVASFLVGAASTGVLWLLHSRALTHKSVHLHLTEGAELQSMLGRQRGVGQPAATAGPAADPNGNCSGCPLLT